MTYFELIFVYDVTRGRVHFFIFCENPMAGYTPWGCKESDRTEETDHAHAFLRMDLTFLQLHLLKRLSLI